MYLLPSFFGPPYVFFFSFFSGGEKMDFSAFFSRFFAVFHDFSLFFYDFYIFWRIFCIFFTIFTIFYDTFFLLFLLIMFDDCFMSFVSLFLRLLCIAVLTKRRSAMRARRGRARTKSA